MLTIKVLDLFETEDLVKKDRQAAMDIIHVKETKEVEDYLAKNNIQATKTAIGTFVQINTPGDGPLIDSGKQVTVIYTGKLFPSGKVFADHARAEILESAHAQTRPCAQSRPSRARPV